MVKVLDCTLRDGGYCNQWKFGKANINKIIAGLIKSKVDIIECGFINESVSFDSDSTKRPSIQDFSDLIPSDKGNTLFVCMCNFGDYEIKNIPERKENFVDGIRVAFHKKNLRSALEFCEKLKLKGYKIFIQAMVSLSYSDEEFLKLLHSINELQPYAFYIVDSFGAMQRRDLIRLFSMVEHAISKNILIGFHSHNNMQLSYSNAQILSDVRTHHNVIIDSSIFGMGRGAGNLNTELFLGYLNENFETAYKIQPLLEIMDEILTKFYQQKFWGYSLPFYLSASLGCHPNYASFLAEKETLPTKNFYEVLQSISPEDRIYFNKDKAEFYYRQYLEKPFDDRQTIEELSKIFSGRKILLIAPGYSLVEYLPKIMEEIANKKHLVMSVNFCDERLETDYIFVSNIKKYNLLSTNICGKVIATSNILDKTKTTYTINFSDYISEETKIVDNAGLMALRFINAVCGDGVNVDIFGMDGYVSPHGDNFSSEPIKQVHNTSVEEKNFLISNELRKLSKTMNLNFCSPTHYKLEESAEKYFDSPSSEITGGGVS